MDCSTWQQHTGALIPVVHLAYCELWYQAHPLLAGWACPPSRQVRMASQGLCKVSQAEVR